MNHRPHSLLTALFLTTIIVTIALAGLGWRLLAQQRTIDAEQRRSQLESAAEAVAASIRSRLAEAGERLTEWVSHPSSTVPSIQDAIVVAVNASEARVNPRGALPFLPVVRESPSVASVFASAEALEFGTNAWAHAARAYRTLADDKNAHVRAGALLRLGRVLRKMSDLTGARSVYRDLAQLGDVRADGWPAELAGIDGERLVQLALHDQGRAAQLATRLLDGLDSGRWQITSGVAEFHREQLGTLERPAQWQLARALADNWAQHESAWPSAGQSVSVRNGQSVLVLWRAEGARVALAAAFIDQFVTSFAPPIYRWELDDAEGHYVAGHQPAPTGAIMRVGGSAGFPWTLRLWPAPGSVADQRGNASVLLVMMAATLLFVWGATYFMARAIRREAEVARLQSDFVAAVSHEFRSPLTTIRQMAEMLDTGRLTTEGRRRTYYSMLIKEAARLQKLVETLLNFGRIEAGAERYEMREIDLLALVQTVAEEAGADGHSSGSRLDTSCARLGCGFSGTNMPLRSRSEI